MIATLHPDSKTAIKFNCMENKTKNCLIIPTAPKKKACCGLVPADNENANYGVYKMIPSLLEIKYSSTSTTPFEGFSNNIDNNDHLIAPHSW